MRPVQEKLREEFEKKTITKTSMEDLQVAEEKVAQAAQAELRTHRDEVQVLAQREQQLIVEAEKTISTTRLSAQREAEIAKEDVIVKAKQ